MGTIKGRKHFGEAIIDDVVRLRSEGKSHREISEIFGFEGAFIYCPPNRGRIETLN